MKTGRLIAGIACGFMSVAANAEDDTFTQVGTWSCVNDLRGNTKDCGPFQFPKEFGGEEKEINVVVNGCAPPPAANIPLECASSADRLHLLKPPNPLKEFKVQTPATPFYDRIWSGTWVAVGPKLYSGTATAKYLVLTVVYAPPGTKGGGKGLSSVKYDSNVTSGSMTSASQSFQNSIGVSVKTDGSGTLGAESSFEYTTTKTDTQTLEIKSLGRGRGQTTKMG